MAEEPARGYSWSPFAAGNQAARKHGVWAKDVDDEAAEIVGVLYRARNVDDKTMGLQYLEALKALGAAESTKFVLPLELTNLLQGVAGYAGTAFRSAQRPSASDGSATEPAPTSAQ